LIPRGQKCEITGPAADPRTERAVVSARPSQNVGFLGLSMLCTSSVTSRVLARVPFASSEASVRLCTMAASSGSAAMRVRVLDSLAISSRRLG